MRNMPDIAQDATTSLQRKIDWVGMSDVEGSFKINGERVPSVIDVNVNLSDVKSKGIHMSRLYLAVADELSSNDLDQKVLSDLLVRLIEQQQGISDRANLKISFDLSMMRKALVSQTQGERHYPVVINAEAIKKGSEYEFSFSVGLKVLYSSTCPCSAALSRQLIEAKWKEFSLNKESVSVEDVSSWLRQESSMVATPHAQRSEAHVKFLTPEISIEMIKEFIIRLEEKVLKTPVQTAVKREDEQEFARLNGTNLMFCEDAARRVADWLDKESKVNGYWARMEHRESLHAHNAVSEISNNWRN